MKLSLAVWWSTMVTLWLWYECKTAIFTSTSVLSFHSDVGVRVSRSSFWAIFCEHGTIKINAHDNRWINKQNKRTTVMMADSFEMLWKIRFLQTFGPIYALFYCVFSFYPVFFFLFSFSAFVSIFFISFFCFCTFYFLFLFSAFVFFIFPVIPLFYLFLAFHLFFFIFHKYFLRVGNLMQKNWLKNCQCIYYFKRWNKKRLLQ